MNKYLFIVLFFLISIQVFSQSNYELDIYFVSFPSGNSEPETKYYLNGESINAMYEKYNAERLPMRIATNGQIEAIISCDDILNVGICVPMSKYDSLSVQSALRVLSGSNHIKLNTLMTKLVDKADTTKGLIFIRLDELLKKAYYKKEVNSDEVCCPEKEVLPWQNELKNNLCSILQGRDGLAITFKRGDERQNQVILRSFGLGAKNLNENDRLQKIEPRQYITIYEKEDINGNINPLWWLEKKSDDLIKLKYPEYDYWVKNRYTKFYPVQKHKVIDEKSVLEIRFDQEILAHNIDFYGNISLKAKINNNSIEVNPYSVIGEQQKSYGVNSRPIKEIASYFIDLMIKANSVINLYNTHLKNFYHNRSNQKSEEEILILLKDELTRKKSLLTNVSNDFRQLRIPQEFMTEQLKKALDTLNIDAESTIEAIEIAVNENSEVSNEFKKVIEKFYKEYADFQLFGTELWFDESVYSHIQTGEIKEWLNNFNRGITSLNRLQSVLEKIRIIEEREKDKYDKYLQQQIVADSVVIRYSEINNYNKYINGISLCIKYMDYFKSSGDESMKAFLSLSHITQIEFDNLYQELEYNFDQIEKQGLNIKDFFSKKDNISFTENNIRVEKINHTLNEIKESIKSVIDEELKTLLKSRLNYETYYLNTESQVDYLPYSHDLSNIPKHIFQTIQEDPKIYLKFQENISLRAGRELFNRMLYATIDLEKAGAKDGDVIEIKVMWYNIDPNTPNAEEGIELSTAKFIIKKTGWHLDASESVLLIDRFKENLVTTNVSPSNFKPTAGASLLWSYHNDYRGKKVMKFFKWLEPSFGLNVAYLDFTTTETFEIGAGPIVGLWNNRIFFTSGYNFSIEGQSPFYMGIGFSFSNIISKMKVGGKIND